MSDRRSTEAAGQHRHWRLIEGGRTVFLAHEATEGSGSKLDPRGGRENPRQRAGCVAKH